MRRDASSAVPGAFDGGLDVPVDAGAPEAIIEAGRITGQNVRMARHVLTA